jgi:arsenate reductase
MKVSELARLSGIAPSAVRWYEAAGVIPRARRTDNGYRAFDDADLAHLRLVVSLRRLGLGPEDAGRVARLCLDHEAVDLDLAPFIAEQRATIDRRRGELDGLEAELVDLSDTIAAAGRARSTRKERPMTDTPLRVLFVCTGNSARSQIAQALLERFGGPDFSVASAGTTPKGVNPFAIRVLAEIGIDWSAARSKSVEEFVDQSFDYVVTVCDRARQSCPIFPGQYNSLHWGLEDPAEVEGTDEEKLAAFRQTRLELTERLRPFVEIALRVAGRERRPVLR